MIFIEMAIVFLLIYACISLTFIAKLVYRQVTAKKANKNVTLVRDLQDGEGVEEKRVVSSRVIPLTDEYEYDQSTKFKNLSNR